MIKTELHACMEVWDIASKSIVGVEVTANLLEAQELMALNRISRVVVFRVTTPIGMVTQKDLVRYLFQKLPEEDLPLIPVSEIMSKPLIIIDAEKNVEDAAKLMTSNKISSLIVTNKSAEYGLLTKTDICTYFSKNGKGKFKVSEFMTKDVVTAGMLQSVITIAERMTRAGISRVVVVDKLGKPIGIATLSDITLFRSTLPASGASMRKPYRRSQAEAQVLGISNLSIGGVMTPNPATMDENADLAEAATIMSKNGIGGLPVVSGSGKLVGIITKADVVRACAQ